MLPANWKRGNSHGRLDCSFGSESHSRSSTLIPSYRLAFQLDRGGGRPQKSCHPYCAAKLRCPFGTFVGNVNTDLLNQAHKHLPIKVGEEEVEAAFSRPAPA